MKELKFIIVLNKGKLKHYKDVSEHNIILKRNGYTQSQLIETGIIIDKHIYILECKNSLHSKKIKYNKSVYNDVLDWINKNESAGKVLNLRGCGGYTLYKREFLNGD